MAKLASIEQSLTCKMFSNVQEINKITRALCETNELQRLYEQIEQLEQMFQYLQVAVPEVVVPESKKLRVQQRAEQLHTLHIGNVLHIPFTVQQPPMYIVLQKANAQQLQQMQLQLLALIELCALESKDCIIIAGSCEPIVFKNGIVCYDSFMRLLMLGDVSHFCSFEQFVKHSIAAPFAPGSDIVIVDVHEQPFELADRDIDTLQELKCVFHSSVKALIAVEPENPALLTLLDEVFIFTA